jgi:TRAP-type C4-dicarboxylate transport system substrate-binding protein
MRNLKMKSIGAVVAVGLMAAGSAAFAEDPDGVIPEVKINVIGNVSVTTQFRDIQKPFWTEVIPRLSGGKIEVSFKGWNEMGLKGPEGLRLAQRGTTQFASFQLGHVSGEAPINDTTDLAGMSPTIDDFYKVTQAFRPVLEKFYEENFGLKILTMQSFQAQILYCRDEVKDLADLKGRKIRASGASQSDFLSHIGASGIPMSFSEVQQGLQRGVIDCALTGTLGGYSAKWYEGAKYLYTLPINFAAGVTVVNLDAWNGFDADVRKLIEDNIKAHEDAMWDLNRSEGELGILCNTTGPCPEGEPGGMIRVDASAADLELLRQIMLETVLPRWAERCGSDCAAQFNDTIGKVNGLSAPTS